MSTRTGKRKRAASRAARQKRAPDQAGRPRLESRAGLSPRRRRRLSGGTKTAIGVGIVVLALGTIIYLGMPHHGSGAGQYKFAVGRPGPGQPAPGIRLPSTQGGTFDLASMKGQTVLLYFQEGLTCQPCWDQLKDIDSRMSEFRALGIDQVVSITSDPLAQLKQKASDEGLTSPVLSDPNLSVSRAYSANSYGMMGTSRDGHTFIVVNPDGTIGWRADYGGSPDYTMFVPIPNLVADIRAGLQSKGA